MHRLARHAAPRLSKDHARAEIELASQRFHTLDIGRNRIVAGGGFVRLAGAALVEKDRWRQ
ncbi:MAG: hypothetical protein M1132_04145 [Chloroflexi bacterium]|nr:hypothetical protein [Chloroflexota bacterium]